MSTIHALNHASATTLRNTPSNAMTAPVSTAAESLQAIDAKYPNLEVDLAKARQDVTATEGTDTWAGLHWLEKAVFFLLPIGPLLGVVLMSQNGDIHRKAVSTLNELEEVAALRASLVAQVADERGRAMDRVA